MALLATGGIAAAQSQPGVMGTELTPEEYTKLVQSIDWERHTLSTEEFLAKRDAGAVVLDLRDYEAYLHGHIAGALHIDAGEITDQELARLVPDRNQTILIYCDNSILLTRRMRLTMISLPQFVAHGYENVYEAERIALIAPIEDGRLPMVSGPNP